MLVIPVLVYIIPEKVMILWFKINNNLLSKLSLLYIPNLFFIMVENGYFFFKFYEHSYRWMILIEIENYGEKKL